VNDLLSGWLLGALQLARIANARVRNENIRFILIRLVLVGFGHRPRLSELKVVYFLFVI
jgi:hypothetical protein